MVRSVEWNPLLIRLSGAMGSRSIDARLHMHARARSEGSGIFIRALSLRRCLFELTDALARAEHEQRVHLDVTNGHANIAPAPGPAPEAEQAGIRGREVVVARPDGLWEWRVRRDFVRVLRRERRKEADRLAATLGGPRSRQRFVLALARLGDASLVHAFDLHRRRQLRAWAGRVLRAALVQ